VGSIPSGATRSRRVTLYTAPGCGLCDEALQVVHDAQAQLGFELEVVDIEGDDELERRYRVLLPVVEVDGEQAFVYHVDEAALHALLT
jgi:glutaredoxin